MGELRVADFDLRLTLESGQFFRYHATDRGYVLLTCGRAVTLSQDGAKLRYDGADEEFVKRLLGIDRSYAAQVRRLRADPVLMRLVEEYSGLRLMRQDLHETIIGFICSSQSNIPKIRMNLQLIAQHCGPAVGGHHHLPKPGIALNYDLVRAAKTGYRAKFLVETNKMLDERQLRAIRSMHYADAHAALCALPGVGPKIADCICIFALGHGEAFPVDVHILRAMRTLFPAQHFRDERQVREFAQRRWGKDAGLAQQFIYQWARDTLKAPQGTRRKIVKRKVGV